MDNSRLQEGQRAYDSGDYRQAAKIFLSCVQKGTTGNGVAYHKAGNALLKIKRYKDAVTVYRQALKDETYDARTGALVNLGTALAASGDLGEAIDCFREALVDPTYATPYRAWLGIASAERQRNALHEAAQAYRTAAMDASNPSPGSAWLNLGVLLLAAEDASGAADAYRAALSDSAFTARGKARANLGLALFAAKRYQDAAKEFERAIIEHRHTLSPSAARAYEDSLVAVAAERVIVEGWETGRMPALAAAPPEDEPEAMPEQVVVGEGDVAPELDRTVERRDESTPDAGGAGDAEPSVGPESAVEPAAVSEDVASAQPGSTTREDEPMVDRTAGTAATAAAAALGFGDDSAVNDFFNASEEDIIRRGREERRMRRDVEAAEKRSVSWIVWMVAGVVLIAVLGVGGYFLGFGYPTAGITAKRLMAAYQVGHTQEVSDQWVASPNVDVEQAMKLVPLPVKSFAVVSVARGRVSSAVVVRVAPDQGSAREYKLTLVREGVGWKVDSVDFSFRSTGD